MVGDARTHLRTLYGNYWDIGGEEQPDVKVINMRKDDWNQDYPFASTNDDPMSSRGPLSKRIQRMFPHKCKYEK